MTDEFHHVHDPDGRVTVDPDMLRAYLADELPPGTLARVEKALRDSAELRALLEDVRQDRVDAGLHSLGAIWRRSRLTCPSRQQLGSLLLDALDPDLADYLRFHIEVVECPYCQANLADLEGRAGLSATTDPSRQHRILQSSRHLLGEGNA
ncbi:hypothetical protein TA3x_001963 [Tundrisphaera sp. TA3]|uniref:hypothetical protein n=1 Tax=Tundrisphaera sp. TA3 TaxID=3435775 RepID=UPI003EBA27DF